MVIRVDMARRAATPALLATAVFAVVTMAARYLPPAVDWQLVWRPGALALMAGESPYAAVPYFSAAPWGLLPLLPLALLPEAVGRGLLFAASGGAYAYVAWRLGAKPAALAAFLLSPPVLHGLLNGNLDSLALLGFVLPPRWGLFFLAVKPQVGVALAVFWAVEAWRAGRWRALARLLGPICAAYLVSFALFGFWPAEYAKIAEYSQGWNASLWPMSIPVGLALLVQALRRREMRFALPASPCLSPYVLFHSWSAALVALARSTPEMVAAVAGLWVLVALRAW
jgi:hypothetical protein